MSWSFSSTCKHWVVHCNDFIAVRCSDDAQSDYSTETAVKLEIKPITLLDLFSKKDSLDLMNSLR